MPPVARMPDEAARLNVEGGDASPGVSILDASRLARRAFGLDPL